MNITLKWKDVNEDEQGTRIYRSESPFGPTELPPVLTTVESGITTYVDTTVTRGKTYYYRLEVFKDDQVTISNLFSAIALKRSGPGPQTLLKGDMERGFYGIVTANEFVNGYDINLSLGISGLGTDWNMMTDWFKFAYKGKVLFIPMKPLKHSLSWQQLYNLGLVYGEDGPGAMVPNGVTPVNQLKTIEKYGERYLVRLMKGANRNPVAGWGIPSTPAYDTFSLKGEWDDLFCMMIKDTLFDRRESPWGDYNYRDLYQSSDNMSLTLCQELNGDNSVALYRGIRSSYYGSDHPGYASFLGRTETRNYSTGLPYHTSAAWLYPNWRPVLEYIPEVIAS